MAWYLYRLGRWSFRQRRWVAGFWVALIALVAVGAFTLSGKTNDNFELPGIESSQALDLIEQRSPNTAADPGSAQVIFEASQGQTLDMPQNKAIIAETLESVRTEEVQSVADPFSAGTIAPDGRVGYATVTYTKAGPDLADSSRHALEDSAEEAKAAGLNVVLAGTALPGETELPVGEIIGIGVAVIVLSLTFGSLVAAGMPLLTALLGVGLGVLSITLVTGFADLSSLTPALGSMLGLAVGIDYALFIMSRYQHEVRAGHDHEEAAGRAAGTAGSAVVFAGLTVVIALAGLSVCGVGFLTQMGLGGAFMVSIAVLISLTLLPAVLGFAGKRVTSGRLKFLAKTDPEGDNVRTNGRRWIETVRRYRWPALVAGIAVSAVVSIPVASMELSLPDGSSQPAETQGRQSFDLLADNFGPGVNGPLVVVVDTKNAQDPAGAVEKTSQALQSMAAQDNSNIASIVPATTDTTPAGQQALAQQLDAVQFATITVIPKSGPADSETKNLVADIRNNVNDLPDETGARALVTGQTAIDVDLANKLQQVFPLYLCVVVGLAIVLLIAVFRSIWVPFKAAVGFLLSLGVSLGASVAVFQWGWFNNLLGLDSTSPVLFVLPILLTGILFGLAMDYEVFLVTRMREAYIHGVEARQAVIEGISHSARVVVAAAVIMIGVFGGFALSGDPYIKGIGFALAVGVIADAFLVRMLILPALMLIVGKRIWWMPKWLDRLVPDVDVEGENLAMRLAIPQELPAPSQQPAS